MMDVNVYVDAVVSSTCQMLFRKATDSDKVLWWCGVASILMALQILYSLVILPLQGTLHMVLALKSYSCTTKPEFM